MSQFCTTAHVEITDENGELVCAQCGKLLDGAPLDTHSSGGQTRVNNTNVQFSKNGNMLPTGAKQANLNSVAAIRLRSYCDQNGLSKETREQIFSLLSKITDKGKEEKSGEKEGEKEKNTRYARNQDLVACSVAYIVLRRNGRVVTMSDMSKQFNVPMFDMGNTYLKIIKKNDIQGILRIEPHELVEPTLLKLQLSREDTERIKVNAVTMTKLAKANWITGGRQPRAVARAAIFLAIKYTKPEVSVSTKDLESVLGLGVKIKDKNRATQDRVKEITAALAETAKNFVGGKADPKNIGIAFSIIMMHLQTTQLLAEQLQKAEEAKKAAENATNQILSPGSVTSTTSSLPAPETVSALKSLGFMREPTAAPPAFVLGEQDREIRQAQLDKAKIRLTSTLLTPILLKQKLPTEALSPCSLSSSSSLSDIATPVSSPCSPLGSSPPFSPKSQSTIQTKLEHTPITPILTPAMLNFSLTPTPRFAQTAPTLHESPDTKILTTKKDIKKIIRVTKRRPPSDLMLENFILNGVDERTIVSGHLGNHLLPNPLKHSPNCPHANQDDVVCECCLSQEELNMYLEPDEMIAIKAEILGFSAENSNSGDNNGNQVNNEHKRNNSENETSVESAPPRSKKPRSSSKKSLPRKQKKEKGKTKATPQHTAKDAVEPIKLLESNQVASCENTQISAGSIDHLVFPLPEEQEEPSQCDYYSDY
eukprot:TRINITY_DN2431_c0_g1_i16.p1 TRINITY_DN2431_c0_g1~~TRINITY_DN2431_c0_g1_i16.p1  ORF type:complete len:707 (-),score=109.44 TRINITY_DN2431_c0_g1_i16:3867-5987(-)